MIRFEVKTMEEAALKQWRERHGLTQYELADLLKVRAITISRWERGAAKPPGDLLALALETLDRRLSESHQ
jgi:transcriptional regulator with XRE-family HTH domain